MSSHLRAAVYLRISKDDARTGLAVDRQRSECMRVVDREGLTLVETYADNGVSAYNRNVRRPEFDRMTRDYEAGRFDIVVTWDLDRFSRQPAQLEHWIEMGEARGLRIISPSEVTDLGTDNGRMFARMKATIARAEVERKSARQRAQVAQARQNGTYKPRIGFNDAEVIRRIFARLRAGEGVYVVARALNDEGLTTMNGRPWSGQAVRGVAQTVRHRGAAVTEADFDAVTALLSRPEKVGPKARGLFSGVARCSTCDASMTASGTRYVCSYATNHPGSTGHQTITRSLLEPAIDEAMISAFTFGHGAMERPAADVSEVDAELANVAAARERVVRLVARDLVSEAEASTQLRELQKTAERLSERRQGLVEANARLTMLDGLASALTAPGRVSLDDAVKVKQAVRARWLDLDFDKRRELAREYLRVMIMPRTETPRVAIEHRIVKSLNSEE